jgi:hypothetical protein
VLFSLLLQMMIKANNFANILQTTYWHATIWKERNTWIFQNHAKEVDEIVDEIKVVSWFWVLSRLKIASCFLFYFL